MKRIVAGVCLVGLLTLIAGACFGERGYRTMTSRRTALRSYVGATPQQYDTLFMAGSNDRTELWKFAAYMDDSAQANGILTFWFIGQTSGTTFLKLHGAAFTANELRTTTWDGPFVFPAGENILIYYNITAATPATLDTIFVQATYK